ncbi:Calcium/calmodulin-dependent protein kinase kinase 1 [Phytophthora citrophthora]|uniref:Calcium/calmodulin-dependent protein kinase kinase 1 n=1 Tax=Phytophthora citrophthora TaxID=4793 RepID=A0AAD9LQT8_9STRA|nr:Calcium/calmodulin-dependent protein kinase kinase 1 [Phytophthora citrophthora]
MEIGGLKSYTSMSGRRWNIAETHSVVKQKTETGDKFVNNYRLLQTLGQGRFGKVKLCERLANGGIVNDNRAVVANPVSAAANGDDTAAIASLPPPAFAPPKVRQFAMKIFSKKMLRRLKDFCAEPAKQVEGEDASREDAVPLRMRAVTALDRVHDEIEIMRSLYHRNIVLLFEVIEADDSDKLYMVLEYMECGPCMVYRPETKDFSSRITSSVLPEELARNYLSDILFALQYLHQRKICHRDLKPDNILLNDSGRCHITDFGCAKDFSRTSNDGDEPTLLSDTVGTYQFLAPECCSGEPYDPFKVDIWAVGVVFFIFLFGRLPFTSESTRELFDEIIRAEIMLPGTDESRQEIPVSPEGQDLLLRLLEKDPNQRIAIAECLSHPWFAQHDDDEEPLSF